MPLNVLKQPPENHSGDWWNAISFRSLHPGGGHFSLADGSAHFINEGIEHSVYRALGTRDRNMSSQNEPLTGGVF